MLVIGGGTAGTMAGIIAAILALKIALTDEHCRGAENAEKEMGEILHF